MLRIAQISDLHVRRAGSKKVREFDAALAECVARVNALAPDVVIATGDLTNRGSEEEYRRLREMLNALDRPYYLMPGNHDDPAALRTVFNDRTYLFENDSHASYAVDFENWVLLMLDSTKDGRAGGYVDGARLAWLESQLKKRANAPTLLALHHPPFAAGVWPMDWLGFTNLRELEQVVRSHSQIRRIVSGHVHCFREASWGGTSACTSPSTRSQRLLVGLGWRFPKLHFEQSGFLLHSLYDNGEIVTQVQRIVPNP
jgi:3',5'-cyclic-AMP phosphodiesterase